MGIKPEVILSPSVLAEFEQRAATMQKALTRSQAMQSFISQAQDFQDKLKAWYENSGLAKLAKQIKNTFDSVKDWIKKSFVQYFPIVLQLVEIPRAQIQPSSGKALQLPNSFRSHSPPLYSVIV